MERWTHAVAGPTDGRTDGSLRSAEGARRQEQPPVGSGRSRSQALGVTCALFLSRFLVQITARAVQNHWS